MKSIDDAQRSVPALRWIGCALAAQILSVAALALPAAAQATAPTPSPSAAPQAAPAWHNPVNTAYSIVDVCGGPKELIAKINPSPCVLIPGQAQISFGYANINAPGSLSITGPLQHGVLLPTSGNANAYPLLTIAAGVTAHSQLSITAPSEVIISTQRLGSTSAATDLALNYKQFVYFSPKALTLGAVAFGYTPPTNGTSLGPAYTIQPQIAQPVNSNVTLGAFWTFKNAALNQAGAAERAWSDPLGFYVAWSPQHANFAILPVLTHSFNPNRTPLVLDAMYLFNRHSLLNVSYGGLDVSSSAILPSAPNVTFAANVNPRLFAATLYFLIGGESNLPPMPPPPAATPAPQGNR